LNSWPFAQENNNDNSGKQSDTGKSKDLIQDIHKQKNKLA
jgi:hypothetical protein